MGCTDGNGRDVDYHNQVGTFGPGLLIQGPKIWDELVRGESPVDELLAKWLPQVVNLFRSKARDYEAKGDIFAADLLGAKGQFAELWRKVPKLKRAMWDGEPLAGETVQEVLFDFIGHCLLALDYLGETEIPEEGHVDIFELRDGAGNVVQTRTNPVQDPNA